MIQQIRDAWGWLRRRPTIADGLLAAVLATIALWGLRPAWAIVPGFTEPDALAVVLALMQTLPLTFRRWRPMEIYAVVGISTVVYAQLGYPATTAGLGVLVALYTVASQLPMRTALTAGVIYVGGLLLSLVGVYRTIEAPPEAFARDVVLNLLVLVLAWIVGVTIRTRRAYIAELEARTALLEREREENAQLAVALERGRIGRELHDVVAHAVSVMVVQASGAERLIERDPARARDALSSIAATGREALGEMRRLVGAIGHEGEGAELVPQPGLNDLEALVERVRQAGLPVELVIRGEPRPLPTVAELSAYRIVQEALTNSLKHAGPTRARVIVRYEPDSLELRVSDSGRPADEDGAVAPPPGEGHGLIGMRERVALFNGQLEAGPRPEGGYAVVARLPLEGIGS